MKNSSKNFKFAASIFIVSLTVFLFWCVGVVYFSQSRTENSLNLSYKTGKIALNGSIFDVEVADTDSLRSQGLSGRKNLASDAGMWFIFGKEGYWGFWMKDMNFPLDIIWFDEDQKIISFEKNLLPETYPQIFYPAGKAKYVLEVKAGFAEKAKIKIGDQATVVLK